MKSKTQQYWHFETFCLKFNTPHQCDHKFDRFSAIFKLTICRFLLINMLTYYEHGLMPQRKIAIHVLYTNQNKRIERYHATSNRYICHVKFFFDNTKSFKVILILLLLLWIFYVIAGYQIVQTSPKYRSMLIECKIFFSIRFFYTIYV